MQAPKSMTDSDDNHAQIVEVLKIYFDGWHYGDPERLKRVFHPSCHLYCAIGGKLDDDGMDKVYGYVAGRPSPKSQGAPRRDLILTIDLSGAGAACAKVQLLINGKLFTDYLSLLRLDEGWRIVAKTFSHVPFSDEPPAPATTAA